MEIDPKTLAIIAVIVVAVVVVIVVVVTNRRKALLRQRFGPEYEREVRQRGSERAAQVELSEREKRVSKFNIRELGAAEQQQYLEHWRKVQARFVDDPKAAVADADESVGLLMGARGYPVAEFEQRAADLSVEHPRVVEHYRVAHEIALRHRQGKASTEDMRQAMIHYKSLFEELLNRHSSNQTREVA